MIQQDIREHIATFDSTAVFSYGRPFDTALDAATIEINQYFIHLDPIRFEGVANETELANVSIGFLLQDKPDSSFDNENNLDITDSIETIQYNAKVKSFDTKTDDGDPGWIELNCFDFMFIFLM